MEIMRHELKYHLQRSVFRSLQNNLARILSVDVNGSEAGYRVRSLYFDTLDDLDLHASLDGVSSRHKLRLRYYNNDVEHVKLELKIKEGHRSYKKSIVLNQKEVEELLLGRVRFLANHKAADAQLFLTIFQHSSYRPKVMVEYHRIAYVHAFSNLRICYDTDIRISSRNTSFLEQHVPWIPLMDVTEGVFEVKYDEWILTSVQMLLGRVETNAVAFSKYVSARMRTGGL